MNTLFGRLSALILLSGAAILVGCSQSTPEESVTREDTPTPGDSRIFELRTYTAYPGKLADLERRFRDHTTRLFERHGMTNIGYWTPQDSTGENTIVYLLAYPSREAATSSWEAFRADPEWVAAKAASEENGLLVERVVSVFLSPTDFSPMK